jgi:hypothetical protein
MMSDNDEEVFVCADGSYRVQPASDARTRVVVYHSTSGRKSYQEVVPTGNNLERFIGIWSDLSKEDERLFNEIFAERKDHFG